LGRQLPIPAIVDCHFTISSAAIHLIATNVGHEKGSGNNFDNSNDAKSNWPEIRKLKIFQA